jgi:hypothetical protein
MYPLSLSARCHVRKRAVSLQPRSVSGKRLECHLETGAHSLKLCPWRTVTRSVAGALLCCALLVSFRATGEFHTPGRSEALLKRALSFVQNAALASTKTGFQPDVFEKMIENGPAMKK